MYYGEFETDKYIRENFFSDFSYKGIMVEVGAGPPEYLSMSKHFKDNGWRCICIDPNPDFVKQHEEAGGEIYQVACSDKEEDGVNFTIVGEFGLGFSSLGVRYNGSDGQARQEITVDTIRLDTLLEKLNIDKIDFLSIDVEGWEIEVLKGFSIEKYQPKVVVLENYILTELYVGYMLAKGYKLHHKIDYNYIFIRE